MAEATIQEKDVAEDVEIDERHNTLAESSNDSKEYHRVAMENISIKNCYGDVTDAEEQGIGGKTFLTANNAEETEEQVLENKHSNASPIGTDIITGIENLTLDQNNLYDPEVKGSPCEDQIASVATFEIEMNNHNDEAVLIQSLEVNQNSDDIEVCTSENAEYNIDVVENLNQSQDDNDIQSANRAHTGMEEDTDIDGNAENVGNFVENSNDSQGSNEFPSLETTQAGQGEEVNTDENEEDFEDAVENLNDNQNDNGVHTVESAEAGQEEGQDREISDSAEDIKPEKDNWAPDDITALLIKAINFHASKKDLRTVIGCGADVNRTMRNGLSPLHYAAYSDYAECVELLLNSGANVNATDDIGYTPLHLAARRGNPKCLEMLLENGAIINYSDPGTEIHQTDEKNKLGYTTMEPLNLAIQNGNPVCAKLLLEMGARPDNRYFMGFEICLAPLDDPECLELLLQYGANPNVFNRCGLSPLMKACRDHHIEAVRKLIKYGADVNAICPPLFEQKSVLQYAINSGNIVIINILLGKGAKLARQGEYKYNALHSAILKGRAEICRLMLQHGADANERTDEGATPMMLACSTPDLHERREIVQLLLDCGADINAHSPCYSYFDPYLAPITEYFKCVGSAEGFSIVRLLIRNGAKVNFSSSGLDMEQRRLRDPFSVVSYVKCMENNLTMFDFVVSAAYKYSPLIIHATENIPEHMKDSLLYTATRPRELKHQVRAFLRDSLTPGLPSKVQELPLPPLLKAYLLFKENVN